MSVGSYELDTSVGQVRLLLNDVANPFFFSDNEVQAFLDLEGGSVKRAAAQAIDTNADSEALASKVLRSQDVATGGASVANVLRARAALLREQAEQDDGCFDIVDVAGDTDLIAWPVVY